MTAATGYKEVLRQTSIIRTLAVATPMLAAAVLLSPEHSLATASWSAKYKVNCQTCHTPAFARLNLDGEKFLWNGYQNPDADEADGNTVGKQALGDNLSIDRNVRNWLMARLSINPIQAVTNGQVIDGKDTVAKVTVGATPWVQLFVAGSIAKNISIYIENEFEANEYIMNWYYMNFTNLFGTKWANLQVGRISPVLFMPLPDRLPMMPAIGGPGVMRVKSSNGKGDASVDLRSARHGVQYYGYNGPIMVFAGASAGAKASYAGYPTDLGYWAGARLFVPESKDAQSFLGKLEGTSIGFEYMSGTDIKGTNTKTENSWQRYMPGVNIRYADKIDIQASYVIGVEDNFALDTASAAKKELDLQGARIFASYYATDKWALQGSYDHYWTKNSLIAEERRMYFPVVTYFPRENIRISAYPGWDLRDVADNVKKYEFLTNIRVGF